MSTPPVQLTRHCRELSPDEVEELVSAVADLIVGYLQAAEAEPLTGATPPTTKDQDESVS